MVKSTVNAIVSAGRATAGPPLAPALAPLGINIGQVVAEINNKTKEFEGVSIPVKVIVDTATKQFEVKVGSPSTAALIMKEIGIEKGAGNREAMAGDISMDKILKIARLKRKDVKARSDAAVVKQVIGTCMSVGVTIEGKKPSEKAKEVDPNFKL